MQTHLDAAQQGRGSVVLIAGEPGIGKTRLLREIAGMARSRNVTVLAGRANESPGSPPYLPFARALGKYVRTMPLDDLRRQLGDSASDVALVVPEIGRRLAHEAPELLGSLAPYFSFGAQAAWGRYRLFESVSTFVLAIAGAAPHGLLLMLDDLHWADEPTLLLLHHLIGHVVQSVPQQGEPVPLLLACAYRTTDLAQAASLTNLLAELSREDLARRLLLAALSEDDATALIEALSGARPAPAVAEAIYRATEGSPFFLQELVRHLLEEGRDLTDPRTAAQDWAVPEGVRQVVGHRLARLSAIARMLLKAGAVLGDGFSFDLLRAMLDLSKQELSGALDIALDAGLLREAGARYRFPHALFRQTIYRTLRLPECQRLHREAVAAIETVHAHNLGRQVAALAEHCRQGGEALAEKGLAYSLQAGDAAAAVSAWEDAAVHWQAALDILIDQGSETGGMRHGEILERLGQALYLTGSAAEQGLVYLEEALQLYQTLGEQERAAEIHVRLGTNRSIWSTDATVDTPHAQAHFRAAEAILAHGSASPAQADLFVGLATMALRGLRTDEGLRAARQGLEVSEQLGDGVIAARALTLLAFHTLHRGRLAEGLALLDHAWEAADRHNAVLAAYLAVAWRGELDTLVLGDPRDAQFRMRRELAKPRLAQIRGLRQNLLGNLVLAHIQAGELGPARAILAEGEGPSHADVQLSTAAGEWDVGVGRWLEERQRFEQAGDRFHVWGIDYWLGQVQYLRGDFSEAERYLQEALAIAVAGPVRPAELSVRAFLARVAIARGDAAAAAEQLGCCETILAEGEDWRGLAGRVALATAGLASLRGSMTEAAAQFEQALATFRRFSLPWDEAEALHQWGRALTRAGRQAQAGEKLSAAEAIYRRLRAGPLWFERLTATEGRRTRRPPSRSSARDELSKRESQVLRLLAAGKTNQQIAADLVLSIRTVELHVSSIYAKIGVSGPTARIAAAAYATRHGLLPSSIC